MSSMHLAALPEPFLKSVLLEWCNGIKTLVNLDTALVRSAARRALWEQLKHGVLGRCEGSHGEHMFRWLSSRELKVATLTFDSEGKFPKQLSVSDSHKWLAPVLEKCTDIQYAASEGGEDFLLLCLDCTEDLRRLKVYDSTKAELSKMLLTTASMCCRSLRSLEVSLSDRFGRLDANAAAGLGRLLAANQNLEFLHLECVPMHQTDAEQLPACLTKLILCTSGKIRYRVSTETVLTIVQRCPALRHLEITEDLMNSSNQLSITDDVFIAIAERLPNIEQLILCTGTRGSAWSNIAPITGTCRKLQVMELSGCNTITSAQFAALISLPLLSSLKLAYKVGSCQFQFDGVCAPQLRELDLVFFHGLTDQDVIAIIVACPQLATLSMSGCNRLTSQGVVEVLKRRPCWKSLSYYYCGTVSLGVVTELLKKAGLDCEVPNLVVLSDD